MASAAVAEPPRVNGPAAVGALAFQGFALQVVQVGVLPLMLAMGKSLHASTAGTSWILTSALLSGAVFLAVMTRLADLVGKRPVLIGALVLVLAGCVIDSVATTLPLVIIGRVLIGAQLPLLALPEAIASDTMTPKRAHTAIFAIHVGTGSGVAGGLIVAALAGGAHWHAFFVISAVITVIGLIAIVAFVKDSPARAAGGLDVPGAVLLTLTMVALLLGFSEGPAWGWGSASVLGLLIGGVVLGVAWWARERTAKVPLIDVRYLTRREVSLPYIMTFLVAFGIYGSLSAVSRIAQTPAVSHYGYGWSTLMTGWYAVPQEIGALLAIVALAVARRRGLPMAAAVGCLLITVGFVGYSLGAAVPAATMVFLGMEGCGLAVAIASTQLTIVRSVPAEESGIALGLSVVMYAVGNTVGSAVFGVLFASFTNPLGKPTLTAYVIGFVICGACGLLALILCLPLSRRPVVDRSLELAETA
ncbi:MAG: MFS transporter [Streptosporangiales bacterium]|nr:MFS transporter [Streptosporangiales bacterium]